MSTLSTLFLELGIAPDYHSSALVGLGLCSGLFVAGFIWYVWLRRNPTEPKTLSQSTPASPEVPQTPSRAMTQEPSWQDRLREGLSKTRDAITGGLDSLLGRGGKIDESLLENLHELLFRSDIGIKTADTLVDHLRQQQKTNPDMDLALAKSLLREKSLILLDNPSIPLAPPEHGPMVILVVGVNGVGKTTSIGKLASYFKSEGKSVLLAAGDTFRAAAIDQLKVWADRLDIPIVAHQAGSDPAAVCYDAVKAAMARKMDILLIDTAGRLQNKSNLMLELDKIKRVIGKDLPGAPQHTWLVIDATTGQNAFSQVKSFQEVVALNGLVVTKLDGTAKGGVIIGVSHQYKVPVRFIGVGEKAADLRPFDKDDFVNSIFSN